MRIPAIIILSVSIVALLRGETLTLDSRFQFAGGPTPAQVGDALVAQFPLEWQQTDIREALKFVSRMYEEAAPAMNDHVARLERERLLDGMTYRQVLCVYFTIQYKRTNDLVRAYDEMLSYAQPRNEADLSADDRSFRADWIYELSGRLKFARRAASSYQTSLKYWRDRGGEPGATDNPDGTQ